MVSCPDAALLEVMKYHRYRHPDIQQCPKASGFKAGSAAKVVAPQPHFSATRTK
jgi:hypothetical protein